MKEIATFFTILSVLMMYIAFVVAPIGYCLHKCNILNHKSRLFLLYTLIAMAFFVSLLNPEIDAVTSATEAFKQTQIGQSAEALKGEVGSALSAFFSSEEDYYRSAMIVLSIVGFIGVALYALSFLMIALKIIRLRRYRKFGKVTLLTEDKNITPHVFSAFGRSYLVLPEKVIGEKAMLLTSIKHEFQHIRNGDTFSIYVLHLLRCLLWVNPAIHFIANQIKGLQEIRVDDNLIHDKKIGYKRYLHTLNWFITSGQNSKSFGLSYSIFGWSTFRELRNRVQNIRRVRPIRSQPLLFGVMFITNVFVLLAIANSTPKFNYSLYELKRMLMPEYMKKQFVVTCERDYGYGPEGIGEIHTVDFAEPTTISKWEMVRNPRHDKAKEDKSTDLHNSEWVNVVRERADIKVVEYNDTEVVVDADVIVYPVKRESKFAVELEETKTSPELKYKKQLKLPYGSEFSLEGIAAKFRVTAAQAVPVKINVWNKPPPKKSQSVAAAAGI